MRKDFGDFQTPMPLAEKILTRMSADGRVWTRALEPTCGRGNFIRALLRMPVPPKEIVGLEIQPGHVAAAKSLVSAKEQTRVDIQNANIFEIDLRKNLNWKLRGPLLVVGNPPWVTNSELGSLGSTNLPRKQNIKCFSGFDAITGASNFDICEYVWIKLIRELASDSTTIALLCKTSIARNVISFCRNSGIPVRQARMFRIDASAWFDAAVDACLFTLDAGSKPACYEVEIYNSLEDRSPAAIIGFRNGFLIADVKLYSTVHFVEGQCPYVWRQGIKHDIASVVELKRESDGTFRNKVGKKVEIESKFLFPLIKSSDLNTRGQEQLYRWVIVPQKRLHEDVSQLSDTAPKLWIYLNAHKEAFAARKSSIYKDAPPFSYFGLGEYSFARFKIAVSGLYKDPKFSVLTPYEDKPVMLDDTCYFLSFDCFQDATDVIRLLNSKPVLDFIKAITFLDSKRPITKKLLQRIDLRAVAPRLGLALPPRRDGQMALT